jgi:hypothetical protein
LSDAFRHSVFDPRGIYDAERRDLAFAGMVRPKLFTEEPSFLALSFVLAAYMWFMISERRARVFGLFALLGAGLFLIRSPVVILGVAAGVLGEWARRSGASSRDSRSPVGPSRRGPVVVMVVVAGGLIAIALTTVFSNRLRVFSSGGDLSTVIRV